MNNFKDHWYIYRSSELRSMIEFSLICMHLLQFSSIRSLWLLWDSSYVTFLCSSRSCRNRLLSLSTQCTLKSVVDLTLGHWRLAMFLFQGGKNILATKPAFCLEGEWHSQIVIVGEEVKQDIWSKNKCCVPAVYTRHSLFFLPNQDGTCQCLYSS